MPGPLNGLRIIEMVGIGPAPFAAMMLADMGAEVIRVHAKGQRPDIPFLNTRFDVLARNRRSLALDLKVDGAVEILLDLIGKSDGVIEGFRPGVMERLGIGPDISLQKNPRLVYGRMTGWGQSGPLASTAGHDLNYIALTGALHAMGPADTPPPVPLNLIGDFGGGGMLMAFGMACGILHAKISGRGQVVDAAMIDGASLLASMFWGFRAGNYWSDQRETNLLDGGAYFYTTYKCADEKYLAVAAVEPKFHAQLIEKLELDPAIFTHVKNPAMWPQLRSLLADTFRTKPRDYWAKLFEGSDACVSPILDWSEAIENSQMISRATLIDVDGVMQPAPAPRFSHTMTAEPRSADSPGAHSVEILREWGIPQEQIDAAHLAGAV